MTAKLQDLVHDVREIFRGDSKCLKGPEAFSLMLTQLESLETQLRDKEATQAWKAVKFNFAAEADSRGAHATLWQCTTASGFSSLMMTADQ